MQKIRFSGMLLSYHMHCVRVVCFVKTLGLSPLRLFGIWVFTFLALHR